MNMEQLNALTKDMSKGVSRLMAKPNLLNDMDQATLEELQKRVNAYSPKSAIGQASRDKVLVDVTNKLSSLSGVKVDVTDQSLSKGEMIEKRTCVLNWHVPQPGLNMCIDTKTFVSRVKGIDVSDVDDTDDVESLGFDTKRHTVVQKLFGKEYLKPLTSQRQEFVSWLSRHAVPNKLLKSQMHLVPRSLVAAVMEKIDEVATERQRLLDQFEGRYEEAIIDARDRLGPHFDPSRYPDFIEIRRKFEMRFRWQDVNPAEGLREINKSAYERERELAKMDWENTFQDIRDGLRAGFTDLTESLATSLGNDETGKAKVFHQSKVQKLKDFLQTFEARDLTDDAELAEVAKQAKDLLSTVDPKSLRKDQDARTQLSQAFSEIAKRASTLVVSRGRKLNLDEDDEI